jgi:tetratricopeptide (TPR) repeat protein
VPNNLPAILKLAGLYELTGDNRQAQNYYQQASNSGAASATLAYAGHLSRTGEQNKALEVLQAVSAAQPDDPNLIRALALALQADDNFDAASSAFQRLEEVSPGNGLPLLVEAYLSRGDVAAASEIAGRVIAESPSAEYGYLLQALIYDQSSEWSAAEANLKRGIDTCELDLNLILKLANVYTMQRKDQQALQVYDKILLSRPQNVPAIFGKALISDVQGNKRKAYELYQTVLALDGEYAPALNNLAYLYVDLYGDHEEALRLAIKAFGIEPENPDFLDTLGYALLKKGQYEKALLFLQKAARLKPHEITIQAHLAEAVKAVAKSSGGGNPVAPAGSSQ